MCFWEKNKEQISQSCCFEDLTYHAWHLALSSKCIIMHTLAIRDACLQCGFPKLEINTTLEESKTARDKVASQPDSRKMLRTDGTGCGKLMNISGASPDGEGFYSLEQHSASSSSTSSTADLC